MKPFTPNSNGPAGQIDSSAVADGMDLDLPDWSAMRPVASQAPIEAVFAECEYWLRLLPHPERILHQRRQTMVPVPFVLDYDS